jgi:hypothetical protein
MSGRSAIVGGTPVLTEGDNPEVMLTGRVVRFPPLLQQDRRRAAVLDEDYYFCASRTGQVIRIPRGYQTDFASIPGVARLLIDRFGTSLEPAAVHDWLYSVGQGTTEAQQEAGRAEADRIFLDALEDNGVGFATRTIMYVAVRLFGGGAYGQVAEWEGRLKNPLTGIAIDPSPSRPLVGTLEEMDCGTFGEAAITRLVGCYSTNPDWLFDEQQRAEQSCGGGDGLRLSRL